MSLNPAPIATMQSSLKSQRTQLKVKAEETMRDIRKQLGITVGEIIQELILSYPPELPDQKYVRTYELMGGWNYHGPIDEPDGSISFTITNNATDPSGRVYAGLVQDENRQLLVHQGRWPTVQEIQTEFAHAQTNRVRAAIRRGMR